MRAFAAILAVATLFVGCANQPAPDQPLLRPGRPLMIVAYGPDDAVRTAFEDQLAADLAEDGIESVAGHDLAGSLELLDHARLMKAAVERDAPMILMVRRLVTASSESGPTPPPEAQLHRTLREYLLDAERARPPSAPAGRQVIEVSGYLRRDGRTELVWNGYAWLEVAGSLETAISEAADIVSQNIREARRQVRGN